MLAPKRDIERVGGAVDDDDDDDECLGRTLRGGTRSAAGPRRKQAVTEAVHIRASEVAAVYSLSCFVSDLGKAGRSRSLRKRRRARLPRTLRAVCIATVSVDAPTPIRKPANSRYHDVGGDNIRDDKSEREPGE